MGETVVYVGREAFVIVRAVSDSEIEVSTAGNKVLRLFLVKGEIFRYRGYVDIVNVVSGSASIYVFDIDAEIDLQVSSSGIIAELQNVAKEATAQNILTEVQSANMKLDSTNTTLSSIDIKLGGIDTKVATETTLQSVLSQLQSANTNLTNIDTKLAQPTTLNSSLVTIDNSAGAGDLVQALFASSTPSKSAIIKRVASGTGDGVEIYLGNSATQPLPLALNDAFKTQIDDLSKIYVRVPPGVIAQLAIVWEV